MKWNPLVQSPYVVTPGEGPFEHVIGGTHGCKGGWCPNCDHPITQLLALDLRDPALASISLSGSVLPLLFCHQCGLGWEPFFYSLLQGDVRIERAKLKTPWEDFPYEDYPASFAPLQARLEPLSEADQETITRLNGGEITHEDLPRELFHLDYAKHQIGGEPYLLQGREDLSCCACRRKMQFLAAAADGCSDPRGFSGSKFLQVLFFICIGCNVIGAVQRCD